MLQDPDFLETLFWPTMNFIDSRTEYTFWSLWSSPLLVATDLRNLGRLMHLVMRTLTLAQMTRSATLWPTPR